MWFLHLLQIIVALIIITILAITAFALYNAELKAFLKNIVKTTVIKRETTVFDGILPIDGQTQITYNTYDDKNGTYIDLSPSINQAGGAEYTYNFWIYLPASSSSASNNMESKSTVLFVRGSNMKLNYKSNGLNCELEDISNNNTWFLVKNPLVKLVYNENGAIKGIITEFNSVTSPDAFHANYVPTPCDAKSKYDNSLGIYGFDEAGSTVIGKWNMITIVIRESNPSSDILFKNQAIVKLYLNGFLYLDKNAEIQYSGDDRSTTMKHNMGNLFVNPSNTQHVSNDPSNSVALANLHYFNYAIDNNHVIQLFNQGFSKESAKIPTSFSNSMAVYDIADLNTQRLRSIQPY